MHTLLTHALSNSAGHPHGEAFHENTWVWVAADWLRFLNGGLLFALVGTIAMIGWLRYHNGQRASAVMWSSMGLLCVAAMAGTLLRFGEQPNWPIVLVTAAAVVGLCAGPLVVREMHRLDWKLSEDHETQKRQQQQDIVRKVALMTMGARRAGMAIPAFPPTLLRPLSSPFVDSAVAMAQAQSNGANRRRRVTDKAS